MIRSQTMSCISYKLTLSQITTESPRSCNDPRSLGFRAGGLQSNSSSRLHGSGAEQDRSHPLAHHPGTCSSRDHCTLGWVESLPPAPGTAKYSTSNCKPLTTLRWPHHWRPYSKCRVVLGPSKTKIQANEGCRCTATPILHGRVHVERAVRENSARSFE